MFAFSLRLKGCGNQVVAFGMLGESSGGGLALARGSRGAPEHG